MFPFFLLRSRRGLRCHGNNGNENNRRVFGAQYVSGSVLVLHDLLYETLSLQKPFFIVFVNIKGYVLKHMIVRNGSFVQESLHKFLNQCHWSLNSFSLSYSQTFWPSSLSSGLFSDFFPFILTDGTVWSVRSQGQKRRSSLLDKQANLGKPHSQMMHLGYVWFLCRYILWK